MSIQDDYFDLSHRLDGPELEAFERVWAWAIENENEVEKLRPIVNKMRSAIQLMFEEFRT